jgi:cardiolipin synthase
MVDALSRNRSGKLASAAWLVTVALLINGCAAGVAMRIPRARSADIAIGAGIEPQRLMIEPRDGVRPLTRALDASNNQIFLETYILTDRRVVRALERASAQGVSVYVMLEHHPVGMGSQPESMASMLRAAGIYVRWTRPGFELTHTKMMILDDRLAVVSTANFSRSAFTGNREILVFDRKVRDVRELSGLFRADWDRRSGVLGDANLLVAPDNARFKLRALIRDARRYIDIYAEELADPDLQRRLVRAQRRGVRVRIILPAGASKNVAVSLSRRNVAVRGLKSPYVHAKVVSVDGRVAYVGSENLSATSLDRNREVGILLGGMAVGRIDRIFASDWGRAVPEPVKGSQDS